MAPSKDTTLAKTISKNILKYRKKFYPGHGGQGECMAAYGAGRSKWSGWERGISIPSDAEQRKLARFFGIGLAELRGEKSPPANASGDDSVATGIVEASLILQERLAAMTRFVLANRSSLPRAHAVEVLEPLQELERLLAAVVGGNETPDP